VGEEAKQDVQSKCHGPASHGLAMAEIRSIMVDAGEHTRLVHTAFGVIEGSARAHDVI
jgi:hypothetical protein